MITTITIAFVALIIFGAYKSSQAHTELLETLEITGYQMDAWGQMQPTYTVKKDTK